MMPTPPLPSSSSSSSLLNSNNSLTARRRQQQQQPSAPSSSLRSKQSLPSLSPLLLFPPSTSVSTNHNHQQHSRHHPNHVASSAKNIRYLIGSCCFLLLFGVAWLGNNTWNLDLRAYIVVTSPSTLSVASQSSNNKHKYKDDDHDEDEEYEHYFKNLLQSLNPQQRCMDDEDPVHWQDPTTCECTDPTVPRERGTQRWTDYHNLLVSKAKAVPAQPTLDLLMLGDSLTERWMGTKFAAKVQVPEFRQVFDQYLNRSFQAAPFGGSGDTSMELLWHVRHGVWQEDWQPRAILLLVGTNDVGRVGCSKRHALAGILHLAQYLHQQRPQALIIIHGLLPRNEVFGDGNYTVGVKWEKLQWMNRELEKFCAKSQQRQQQREIAGRNNNEKKKKHEDDSFVCYYLDNSQMFLRKDDARHINATLMDDALHPTLLGYQIWTPLLVQQILQILQSVSKQTT